MSDWFYCPSCGNSNASPFPANSPVADFFCPSCSEQYELKSQKRAFGAEVLDGAFRTMCERLAASDNPNLLLLNYDLARLAVTNVVLVPKQFFVREIIQERKPLAPTARRAGWGWLIEIMNCVDAIGRREFELRDVYAFESRLSGLYPGNRHVREKNSSAASSAARPWLSRICIAGFLSITIAVAPEREWRRRRWLGSAITIVVIVAGGIGPTSGPAHATTTARIAAHGTCRPSIAMI